MEESLSFSEEAIRRKIPVSPEMVRELCKELEWIINHYYIRGLRQAKEQLEDLLIEE